MLAKDQVEAQPICMKRIIVGNAASEGRRWAVFLIVFIWISFAYLCHRMIFGWFHFVNLMVIYFLLFAFSWTLEMMKNYCSGGTRLSRFMFCRVAQFRHGQVIRFLEQHFFPNETINRALNLFTSGEKNQAVTDWVGHELKQDLSIIAVDRFNGRLAGAVVSCESTEESKIKGKQVLGPFITTHPKFGALVTLYEHAFPQSVFHWTGKKHLYEIHFLAVHPDYQKVGLGRHLIMLAAEQGFQKGYDTQYGFATAEASYRFLKDAGFQTHHEISIKDVFFEGKPLSCEGDPEAKLRVMFKYF